MNKSSGLPGEIGKLGETIAANYLRENGYEILDTNFFNNLGYRRGEIDIIAKDLANREIIFIEVKTRKYKCRQSGNPELAITRSKYHKLSKIISSYLRKKKMEESDYRLDAITIMLDTSVKKAQLRHLKNIYY